MRLKNISKTYGYEFKTTRAKWNELTECYFSDLLMDGQKLATISEGPDSIDVWNDLSHRYGLKDYGDTVESVCESLIRATV
jgi:hypothetical protein